MPIPFILTTLLYTFIAVLAATDASLVSFNFIPAFPALRWVRVHFITLGIVTQIIFGLLPTFTASLSKKERPPMRWDIWLALNMGFITLIAGFSGMNHPMIFTGGLLVFISALLLFFQLWSIRGSGAPVSLKFYITGVLYLLLGIVIGTGIFLNWSEILYIKIPIEVHIHANSWGFMSLVFAGLLVDFTPMITGRSLGTSKSISYIYWGMTLGAFGLVLGPWLGGSIPPNAIGLILHVSATVTLIVAMINAFRDRGMMNSAGVWHLVSSYIWIIAPISMAPFIMLKIIKNGPIESTAPQALIYGWVLQFGIALIPYIARRFFLKEEKPQLGGTWLSLTAATLGSIFVWLSIFIVPVRGVLYGIGFIMYAIALLTFLMSLFNVVRDGFRKIEPV